MVRVTIELVPFGIESRKRVMGIAEIGNDATGDRETGNYTFTLSKFDGKGIWKKGAVTGFPRIKLGPYDLLYRVLVAAGMDKRNRGTQSATRGEE